jgi:hypothetical protein
VGGAEWIYEAIAEALASSLRILQNHIVIQQRPEFYLSEAPSLTGWNLLPNGCPP